MFSALGLAAVLGMFGFEQNILSEYSHSLEFRNFLLLLFVSIFIPKSYIWLGGTSTYCLIAPFLYKYSSNAWHPSEISR